MIHKTLSGFIAAAFIATIVTAIPSHAKISGDAGTRGATFLRIEPGAANAAMGGVYASYGDDAFSLWGQPAAIAGNEAISVSFQHNVWVEDISQDYVGVVYPMGKGRTIGMTLNYLNSGDLTAATENAAGQIATFGGNFAANDYAVSFHYAQPITKGLSAGVTGKYITSEIDDVQATALAADFGLKYAIGDNLKVGGSVTNLGTELTFFTSEDKLPLTYRLGGSYNFEFGSERSILLAGDAWKGPDTEFEFAGGAELRWIPAVALRVGYRTQADEVANGLTAGLGFDFTVGQAAVGFDYGYQPFSDLSDVHRFSLNVDWAPAK